MGRRRALARNAGRRPPGRVARAASGGHAACPRRTASKRVGTRGRPEHPREPELGPLGRFAEVAGPVHSVAAARDLLPHRRRDPRGGRRPRRPVVAGVMIVAWLLVAIAEWAAARVADRERAYAYGVAAPPGLPDDPRGSTLTTTPCSTCPRREHPRPDCHRRSRVARRRPPPRRLDTRALPDRHLRDLLHRRAAALVAAQAAGPSAGGRSSSRRASSSTRVGLAVRASCSRSRSRGTRCSRSRSTARAPRSGAEAVLASRSSGTSAVSATSSTTTSSSPRRTTCSRSSGSTCRSRCARSSSRRDLVLHVHGDQLRRRRVPPRLPADGIRNVRRVPLVLPAPRRRPDRAAGRAHAAARRRRTTRATSTRRAPSS